MATLLGVTAINVLTSNQSLSGDTTKLKGLRQFLLAMPYSLFLFALASLAAAVAIKRKRRMLGCATGTLLAQLLCLVLIGGIVTLVRGEVDPQIVWPFTSGIMVLVLFVWSVMCAYPKVSV
jgi:lipopolysaccharide export LptBFGC system permease protein LptF